jgi:microcystin-dependent protein
MALLHYLWSRVAASNSTADAQVNWAEGQAPSSVNDSARAMMASLAGYRDDIAGAIVTGGTSTAYTVTSYQVFNSLANMSGQMVAFTPHTTNGATVTLNVDGLGAKPLRSAPSVELQAGTLILGTPYTALYNNSDAVWYLHNFYGNPYNIPLGGGLDYWGSTAPNSSFVIPIGQAVSRTTYSGLFTLFGTTYGVGDGSTTFNLPDRRGRVSAQVDASAGRLTDAISGFGDGLGESGGTQAHTLTSNEMPSHTHTADAVAAHRHFTVANNNVTTTLSASNQLGRQNTGAGDLSYNLGGLSDEASVGRTSSDGGHTPTLQNTGGGLAHTNVQPTIVCNYIIRII